MNKTKADILTFRGTSGDPVIVTFNDTPDDYIEGIVEGMTAGGVFTLERHETRMEVKPKEQILPKSFFILVGLYLLFAGITTTIYILKLIHG